MHGPVRGYNTNEYRTLMTFWEEYLKRQAGYLATEGTSKEWYWG